MEIHHHHHHHPPLPATPSPRFTPIAIAPKPTSTINLPSLSSKNPATNTNTNTNTAATTTTMTPQPPTRRELWTDPEKYDLLWSIIQSTGLTAHTIPWDSITIPKNHTVSSARVVIQDIALGKHHITHPTFTPSNKVGVVMVASRDVVQQFRKGDGGSGSGGVGVRGSSKKRKLDSKPDEGGGEKKKEVVVEKEEEKEEETKEKEKEKEDTIQRKITPDPTPQPNPTSSPHSSPPSNSHSHSNSYSSSPPSQTLDPPSDNPEPRKKPTPHRSRRHRSDSPPIELDLSNPRITSYLKAEGYMNEDGTPVKKKRGRPTKDPFGLSVTLKKQLMRMDPNAPPMKKRGRPRKRFLDVAGYSGGNTSDGTTGGVNTKEESISPGLRLAIEKIGEEMDREVEALLDEGRSMRDTEDDDDESDGYDGEVTGVWEGDGTEDEDEGNVREKDNTDDAVAAENQPESMIVDKDEKVAIVRKEDQSVPNRQPEKMAVDNLVERPSNGAVWFST